MSVCRLPGSTILVLHPMPQKMLADGGGGREEREEREERGEQNLGPLLPGQRIAAPTRPK